MIDARASVSLAGAAYQSGVAGRTHAHRGVCARLLGTAVPQDVHEASTPLGWTPPRRSAVRRALPALTLSPPAVPGSPSGSGHLDTHRARTGRTSRLAAIAWRHIVDTDAAWHGPPASGAASEPTRHPLP